MTTKRVASGVPAANDLSTSRTADRLRRPAPNRVRDAILRVPSWVRWLLGPLLLSLFLMAGELSWILEAPYTFATREFGDDVGERLTGYINTFTTTFSGAFGFIDNTLETLIVWIDSGLLAVPWPATVLFVAIVAWRAVGPKMGVFALVALTSLVMIGLWDPTIETVALMLVALTLSLSIAIPLGIINAENSRVDKWTRPILDIMQTMPSMVYLVPALAVFGLGNVAGVIATAVFAIPPTQKYTTVGLLGVPSNTVEAAESFGASRMQVLFAVKVPLALPSIMAGVSQSTMNALGLVIVASIVGGGGLGELVEQSLTRLDTGQALPAGFAIVLIAVLIDRVSEGLAKKRFRELGLDESEMLR